MHCGTTNRSTPGHQRVVPVCRRRRATATLELVLSMPVLLIIIVAIIWLGSSVIAQTEVTIEARHKTWSERSNPTGTALLFLKDDILNEKADDKVEVSPMFDGLEPPESSHDVMAGSWDHDKLPLDKAPNWKQYAIAAANGATGSGQTAYTDASNRFTRFERQVGDVWNNIAVGLIRELTSFGDVAKSLIGNGQNNQADESRERARIQRELTAKRRELGEARRQLRQLDDEASDALRDVLKNKVARLEAEVADLEKDVEALN